MHIEERNTYTVPFVEAVLNEYSTETNDFFKRLNITVGSVLAIGFLEVNSDFKKHGNFENTPNIFIGFELFLQNFNNYEDICKYFSNQTDELKGFFEKSDLYIDKDIPDEVKWTIETEERQIYVALIQVKRAFATCVLRLTKNRRSDFHVKR